MARRQNGGGGGQNGSEGLAKTGAGCKLAVGVGEMDVRGGDGVGGGIWSNGGDQLGPEPGENAVRVLPTEARKKWFAWPKNASVAKYVVAPVRIGNTGPYWEPWLGRSNSRIRLSCSLWWRWGGNWVGLLVESHWCEELTYYYTVAPVALGGGVLLWRCCRLLVLCCRVISVCSVLVPPPGCG